MMWKLVLDSALLVLMYMIIMYAIAQIQKDNSIVDIGWGFGFVLISLYTFVNSPAWGLAEFPLRQGIVTAFVLIWGLRLSIRILIRNKGQGEDFRYRQMRENWGKSAWIQAFFKVFILQGIIMLIVALPLIAINAYQDSQLTWVDYAAIVLFIIGFIFEAGGDYQLDTFKSRPENKGKIMNKGFWRYTRHPNYFGDAVIWWSFGVFALTTGRWYVLISPVLMHILLRFVSGVPLIEKKYDKEARPGWEEYKRRTSVFTPWFPKR